MKSVKSKEDEQLVKKKHAVQPTPKRLDGSFRIWKRMERLSNSLFANFMTYSASGSLIEIGLKIKHLPRARQSIPVKF